jgi:hypothetical protein
MDLYIGRDFSKFAHTRYRKDGSESGEAFREERVVPALEQAIATGKTLTVVIDVQCSAAFLHEVFAKLPNHGFKRLQVSHHLALTANEVYLEHYSILALRYLREGYEPSPKRDAGSIPAM